MIFICLNLNQEKKSIFFNSHFYTTNLNVINWQLIEMLVNWQLIRINVDGYLMEITSFPLIS